MMTKYAILYHNKIISIINFRTEFINHNYCQDNLKIEDKKPEIIAMND